MGLLHKIFKFEGHEILQGPKKGVKQPDSWMWTSWLMGDDEDKDSFHAVYYTFDKKIITQTADKDLLTNQDASVAKISEVPKEFLYHIMKYELRS